MELASFIDDDQPIDWDSAEPSTHDALERAVVSELRVVAGLTAALRRPDDGPTIVSRNVQEPSSAAVTPRRLGPSRDSRTDRARCVWNGLSRARHPGPRSGTEALSTNRNRTPPGARSSGGAPRTHQSRQHRHRFDGRLGLWMDLIRGRTLDAEYAHARHIQRAGGKADRTRPLSPIARAAARARCRALHRDIKARNVMREGGGRIVLMDFGTGVSAESGLDPTLRHAVATRARDIRSAGCDARLRHLQSRRAPLSPRERCVSVSGTDRIEIQRGHDEGRRTRLRDIRPESPRRLRARGRSAPAHAPDPKRGYQTAGEFEHALMSEGVVPPPRPIPRPWRRARGSRLQRSASSWLSRVDRRCGMDAAFPP